MKKTNRTFKRFAAITSASLLAACAVAPLATGITSSAAEKGKVTLTYTNGDTTGHTYNAYKIFSGTVAADGVTLEGIDWASETGSTFLTNLKLSEIEYEEDKTLGSLFTGCKNPVEVAAVLKNFGTKSAEAKAFAEFAASQKENLVEIVGSEDGSITIGSDGYYLIVENPLETNLENKTMTAYLLGVYDAETGADIEVKKDLPVFKKEIQDINDSKTDDPVWGTDADHDIGDKVSFRLTATLPSDYDTYKEYKLVFHDALQDTAFKYVDDSAKISVDGGEATSIDPKILGLCTVNSSKGDDCDFEYVIDDVKTAYPNAEAGDAIVIEYKAELLPTANIGEAGNWNSAYLEYSNNPYYTGTGDTLSKTPEQTVVAFTYQVNINKIDGANNKPLEGAGFTLYKKNAAGEYVQVGEEITGKTTFEFKGLDDGDYKISETTIPKDYNGAEDLEFTITAGHANKTLGDVAGTNLEVTEENRAIFETDIINNSGTTLPGTGGIGTTIFYLGGGAMAAIGGVYLISKRRMKKSEE